MSHRLLLTLCLALLPFLSATARAEVDPPKVPTEVDLKVRFFPATELSTHEVEPRRGISSLLLQNAAVINTGSSPLTLLELRIELRASGRVVQIHPFEGEALAALAARSGALAASGQLEILDFHFHPSTLLAGARVVGSLELAPGEALILGHRALTIQGATDQLAIVVSARSSGGETLSREGNIAVRAGSAAAAVGFPLRGRWFVAAAPSWHSHHRWVVPEEFALDLGRIGEGGTTHRGEGLLNTDYFAWDAEVLAVEGGTVVAAVDRFADIKPLNRLRGETPEAYMERVQAAQGALLASGFDAIAGNLVVVDHGTGVFSHYAHLRAGSVAVEVGQKVQRGQLLGRLGNSGNSTEPHLHFQLANSANPLQAVGLPVHFDDIDILWAETERALQSGDIVETRD